MDGTDGLAAGVAIIAALGLSALASLSGSTVAPWLLVITAAAAAGFLIFNRPPASIFMGDTGSLFLGYSLATIASSPGVAPFGVAVPLLVLSPFVFDAAYTLLYRARRGEAVWRAHRDHLYQRLVRDGVGHERIMLLYCAWTAFAVALALLWLIAPAARPFVIAAAALPPIALVAYVHRREQRAALSGPAR
jgi:UDP-N-acetylmuramyl pentapeptide phosphotransferase/UDP-N-acetylglucosamine-1-phosphate transferase